MNEANNLQTPTQQPLVISDVSRCPSSIVYLEDCVQGLKRFADKHFDLAIVDPPYGLGMGATLNVNSKVNFIDKDWDNEIPTNEYFEELQRVSKNQIVWGGNYFGLPATRCFIVWDKQISEDFSLAMAELAWTSFDKLAKIYRLPTPKNGKIHPTQKPIKLYEWLLHNYASEGAKILDTHLGSGSIACACWNLKFDLTAYEIDKEYYDKACKRFDLHSRQMALW